MTTNNRVTKVTLTPESVMPSGKYKGAPIQDIPVAYLNWFVDNVHNGVDIQYSQSILLATANYKRIGNLSIGSCPEISVELYTTEELIDTFSALEEHKKRKCKAEKSWKTRIKNAFNFGRKSHAR